MPQSSAAQCRLLDFVTDTQNPLAKHVRNPTYILLDTLKEAGDLGQHMGNVQVTVPLAASLCLCAIELVEALSRELP